MKAVAAVADVAIDSAELERIRPWYEDLQRRLARLRELSADLPPEVEPPPSRTFGHQCEIGE